MHPSPLDQRRARPRLAWRPSPGQPPGREWARAGTTWLLRTTADNATRFACQTAAAAHPALARTGAGTHASRTHGTAHRCTSLRSLATDHRPTRNSTRRTP